MGEFCTVQAKDYEIRASQMPSDVTDVYISIFFDGTGNNMYEQRHKNDKLRKKLEEAKKPTILYSISDSLFSLTTKWEEKNNELEEHGLEGYSNQRSQSENNFTISSKRYEDVMDGNGGWKYSNVAILRSLAKNKEPEYWNENGDQKIGVNYNLYIEGSGKFWDDHSDMIGLGMGTGRTGVVGLVSKAVVFVTDFVNSFVPLRKRKEVRLHFAVFGFSRGSTCGRLFSYLVVDNPNNLAVGTKNEFRHYLPNTYWEGDKLIILQDYSTEKKTVDFLGIYDTVSSIGFLRKEDVSTNYGINRFGKKWFGEEKENVNHLHGLFRISKSDAANNWHSDNVTNYGLYSPQNKRVKHTFHICAMDEFRENFALVDLGKNLEGTTCTEVFMPGCHSDIGGGYMNEDDIERYTLRKKIKDLPTRIIANEDPRKPVLSSDLSQKVLEEVGWLDRTTSKKKETYSLGIVDGKGKPTMMTEEQTTYIYEIDDKVEFERFAKEGYSNIALKMMKKRAISGKFGLNWPTQFLPFSDGDNLPLRFQIPEDSILDCVKTDCEKEFPEGERTWICPKMEEYKKIRRKYIHFTCTDELNIEKLHLKASGANIGNPPNWRNRRDYYLLCRLIYKGDEGENGLHYMDDYPV